MNTANKITMSRIFLSVIILFILLFPWHQAGVEMPVWMIKGEITVELKYLIAGGLFVVASLTDFIDGLREKILGHNRPRRTTGGQCKILFTGSYFLHIMLCLC